MTKSKVLAAVGALVAAGALIGVTAAPATAGDGTAYNTKGQYISYSPDAGMSTSCVTRPGGIYLAANNYYWTLTDSTYDNILSVREIYLAAGWYDWVDCLQPGNGSYTETSSLHLRGLAGSAYQRSTFYPCGCGTKWVVWGSNLRAVL
ncbi:hypothetical protein [Streptomyces sp. NPDC058086]|uniref:hypothetical protein n=1 Tax=Streptomyces sp. NPDC058086 TaxID=3346334 RepID=UPI0036E72838